MQRKKQRGMILLIISLIFSACLSKNQRYNQIGDQSNSLENDSGKYSQIKRYSSEISSNIGNKNQLGQMISLADSMTNTDIDQILNHPKYSKYVNYFRDELKSQGLEAEDNKHLLKNYTLKDGFYETVYLEGQESDSTSELTQKNTTSKEVQNENFLTEGKEKQIIGATVLGSVVAGGAILSYAAKTVYDVKKFETSVKRNIDMPVELQVRGPDNRFVPAPPNQYTEMLGKEYEFVYDNTKPGKTSLLGEGFHGSVHLIRKKGTDQLMVAKFAKGTSIETLAQKIGLSSRIPKGFLEEIEIASVINPYLRGQEKMYVKIEDGYVVKNLAEGRTMADWINSGDFFNPKGQKAQTALKEFILQMTNNKIIFLDMHVENLVFDEKKSSWMLVDAYPNVKKFSTKEEALAAFKLGMTKGNEFDGWGKNISMDDLLNSKDYHVFSGWSSDIGKKFLSNSDSSLPKLNQFVNSLQYEDVDLSNLKKAVDVPDPVRLGDAPRFSGKKALLGGIGIILVSAVGAALLPEVDTKKFKLAEDNYLVFDGLKNAMNLLNSDI